MLAAAGVGSLTELEDTLEKWMMSLLSKKMKAAQLISGDEGTLALCDDEKGGFAQRHGFYRCWLQNSHQPTIRRG